MGILTSPGLTNPGAGPALLAYAGGWQANSGNLPLQYWRDQWGVVNLVGVAQNTTQFTAGTAVVATMPVGYRIASLSFAVVPINVGLGNVCHVDLNPNGTLVVSRATVNPIPALTTFGFSLFWPAQ